MLARKPEPYIYIGDLTKIQRKPQRSYSSKNTQRLLRSSISFWMSWGLLGSFCWHTLRLKVSCSNCVHRWETAKNNWVNLHQKIRKKEKHVIYPKLQFLGFHVVSRVGCWNTAQVLLADGRDGAVAGNSSAETSPSWSEWLSEARSTTILPFQNAKINALQVRNIWIIYRWWFFARWFLGADKNHRPPYWSHEIIWNYGTPLAQQSRVIHGSTVNWK